LKTAVLRIVEANTPLADEMKTVIAREFEDAVADVLVGKTLRAVDTYGANAVIMGGGVSANTHIRHRLAETLAEEGNIAKLLVCPPEFSTDNALMIALPGYFHALKKEFADPTTLVANADLSLGDRT
ncbi:tRNA (adenosine(37)-N6)-threonylcarbamoyltransferase complex transferase subunit TsaD, partial [Candidatus Kaiserbacteria bacterium]|nr:tRNA (adenosine(37)-N6)-threonylcarbamoyltransferase complex transferase subunit TsaD [Candidatus Kaiserbacteria bacterium]